jgi:hypothetical protein
MTKPRNRNRNKKHNNATTNATNATNTANADTTTKATTKQVKTLKQPEAKREPQPSTQQPLLTDNTSERRKGKTLKAYELEINIKLRTTQHQQEEQDQRKTRTTQKDQHQQQEHLLKTQHIPFDDYDDIDEDLLHLLTYDSDDYDSTYDPFYDSDDESAFDPFYTCNDESYNNNTKNPVPESFNMPPEYIPFSNYADRCLATCSTFKRHQAMDSRLELLFNAYIQGKLPGHNIDWDNMPLLTSDPNGALTPTDFCYTYQKKN